MLRAFYFFSTRTSYRAKCATFVCNCLTYRLTYISYFIFWPNESNIIRIKWNLVLLWIRILPVYVIRKTMEWKKHGTMVYNFNRNSLRDSRSIEKKKKKKIVLHHRSIRTGTTWLHSRLFSQSVSSNFESSRQRIKPR